MQVAKWGNSLAIRLPASIVEVLQLQIGDEIEIVVDEPRKFAVRKQNAMQAQLERVRSLRGSLPADFKFDREEANSRG